MVLPGLIDTLAQLLAWRCLLWLSMRWRQRFLTQKYFLSTTSLVWSLALHLLCCSVTRKLYGGKINTHTHTRSPYIDHNINIKMRTLYWSVANLKQAILLKSVSRKSTRITSDEFDLVTKDAYKNVSLKSILANMLFCFCICPIFLLMSEKLVFLCKKCGF